MDSILLITENDTVSEKVLSKLTLLRDSDHIEVCDYHIAPKALVDSCFSIVILHEKEDQEQTLKYIQTLKSDKYEIILLVNDYDSELILKAYDEGINDFFAVDSESFEMLIRTINCFKLRKLKINKNRNNILLNELGVLNKETGFYKYKFCKNILENLLTDVNIQNGMFMILATDDSCKTKFYSNKLLKALKTCIREDDVVFEVNSWKYHIMLPNTDRAGVFAFIEKIQNILGNKVTIHAGIAKIFNKTVEKLEKEVFAAYSEACQTNEPLVFLEEKVKGDKEWVEETRNFKLFQNSYNHKLEKVITPVFYRLQKSYEEKLFNTKIEQYTDELQSVFRLKHKKCEGCLKIIYPGFTKLFISITYSGLESPENTDIELELSNVNSKSISNIVEDYIKEFKKFVKE